MPIPFDDLPRGPYRRTAIKAQQAWLFLIAKACNRQIIRYKELWEILDYPNARPLRPVLGHIMHYCQQNDLPPLTLIVVNRFGTPGPGFTAVAPDEFDVKREDVFKYPWYSIVPPTIEELQQAWNQTG